MGGHGGKGLESAEDQGQGAVFPFPEGLGEDNWSPRASLTHSRKGPAQRSEVRSPLSNPRATAKAEPSVGQPSVRLYYLTPPCEGQWGPSPLPLPVIAMGKSSR